MTNTEYRTDYSPEMEVGGMSLSTGEQSEEEEEQGVSFVTLYARIVNLLARNPRMAQEKLARRLDVTMRTVQRHLTELENEGYIHVQRDRKPFTYEIAWDRVIPYFDQLKVKTFRPDILDKIAGLE